MDLLLHLNHFCVSGMSPPLSEQSVRLPSRFEWHKLYSLQMNSWSHLTLHGRL